MSALKTTQRFFVVFLIFALLFPSAHHGAAQEAPDPQPTPEVTPAAIPAGLSAEEWQSVQQQIVAVNQPTAPEGESSSAHTPDYLTAPLRRALSTDGAAYDNFGYSVDIDGEQMIVGSPYSDIAGVSSQGAAYLFRRNQDGEDQWGQVAKIVAPDGLASDYFGYDVAISGDVIAVGAPGDDRVGGGSGTVYLFYRNTGGADAWDYVINRAGGGTSSINFGYAVDLSGDKLVVGDPYYSLGGSQVGQAYIFYRNQGGPDFWGQVQWLGNMNPAADDRFGAAVAIEADLCAIGSPYRDESGATDGGAVYLFGRNSGGTDLWGQIEALSAYEHSFIFTNDRFGSSLALDHETLVVGAPWKSSAESLSGGAAFVFAASSVVDEWDMQAMILPPSGSDFSNFGGSLDKTGQFIVVGASNWSDGNEDNVGAAFLYQNNRSSLNAWGLVQQITAVNGANNDNFARSVAISNDRIALGAPLENVAAYNDQGSVHVFGVQAQDWYIQKSLSPLTSNVQSVATYGDWLAVGLPFEDVSGHVDQGRVLLYRRNLGGADKWELFKQFAHSYGEGSDFFGFSLALYDDLLVVGVPGYDNGQDDEGAITIYRRNQGGLDRWGEVVSYESDAINGSFGISVALHQDLLAIGEAGYNPGGSPGRGQVWMCRLSAGSCAAWKSVAASDGATSDGFGSKVSLDNDTLAVGSSSGTGGSVYIFYRNQGGADIWGQVKKTSGTQSGESYGAAISVSEELIAIGSPDYDNGVNIDQGRVKILGKNTGGASNWGETITILDASGDDNHHFGRSVALGYDRLLVGAPNCSIDGDGCLSAFRRNHGGMNTWGRFERILGATGSFIGSALAIDGETAVVGGDLRAEALYFQANYYMLARTAAPLESSTSGGLGWSVALAGDLLLAGAPDEDLATGAAYLFKKDHLAPASWSLVKRLTASDGVALDRFGASVAVSGDWAAIGAVKSPVTNAGSVYLFQRSSGGTNNWGQFKKIPCPDAGICGFGFSLALEESTLAVGAPNRPGAYLFYRDQGGTNNWGQKLRLDSADWWFGGSLALDGDALLVGAEEATVSANSDQGAAYVYYRNQGGADTWGQVRKLTASDGGANHYFGCSVAMRDDLAVVGAVGVSAYRGAAYVFGRDQGGSNNWGQIKKLTASDAADNDWFGNSVAVAGDHILVGARLNDIAAIVDQGSVYWFWRNYGSVNNWGQISRILLPQGAAGDKFGSAAAVWDDLLAVGAPGDLSSFSNGVGAAHILRQMLPKQIFLPVIIRP